MAQHGADQGKIRLFFLVMVECCLLQDVHADAVLVALVRPKANAIDSRLTCDGVVDHVQVTEKNTLFAKIIDVFLCFRHSLGFFFIRHHNHLALVILVFNAAIGFDYFHVFL